MDILPIKKFPPDPPKIKQQVTMFSKKFKEPKDAAKPETPAKEFGK